MSDAPALALTGVVKSYGRGGPPALDGVDLEAAAGRVTALLGPNGAGKSTLVSLAAGLMRPDAGEVRVLGEDPAVRGAHIQRQIGLAPQEIGVYPQLTVTTNLRAFAELHGAKPRAARARAAELLEPFALTELADRPAGRLSGGEQRRLHAAIALVNHPRLVILDEPTAGADPSTREHILQAVRDLAARAPRSSTRRTTCPRSSASTPTSRCSSPAASSRAARSPSSSRATPRRRRRRSSSPRRRGPRWRPCTSR